MIWTLVEPGIAISAASLATIRPLLRRWRISGFTSSGRSRTTGLRSQDQGSRIRRSSKMPGFGSQDVTLVDIEHGGGAKPVGHKITHLPKVFEASLGEDRVEYGARGDGLTGAAGSNNNKRRMEVKSETFIIDGLPSPVSPPYSQHNGNNTAVWLDQESDDSSLELHRPPRTTKLTMPSRSIRR